MAFELFPILQWLDNSGNPLTGGKIYTYAAGGLTPLATYTDSTGGTPNANPVILDSAGRAQIWFAASSYKLAIKTSADVTLMTVDNITLDNLAAAVASLAMTGNLTMQQSTAATALANQSSNSFILQSTYWTGAASATDQWTIQIVLGAGANPSSTLTFTHSGSSGTVSLNFPSIAATFGNLSAPAFIDSVGSPATAGLLRLATTDAINWRNSINSANVGLSDAGAAAAATGNVSDALAYSGGGYQAAAFVDKSAAPANSGVLRVGNNVVAVAARNAASGADLALLQSDASNNAQITPPIRQVEQVAPSGIASSDLLYADSTAHRWKMNNNNGGADTVVGAATTDTLTNKTISSPVNGFTTVGQSVAVIVAAVDLTAQNNNIGATTLYAVPTSGAGMYRVSGYTVITTAAGVSSTLPNLQVVWTDKDNSVVQTAANFTASTAANTTATDGLTNVNAGAGATLTISVKANTNIQYQTVNYASNAANAMQYAVHIKVEYLG